MAHQEIIIAGFGGQGILSAGRLLAYAGMLENKNVSWLPSYGPEMRGGTANCNVIISDDTIGSPILNSATVLVAMNGPSLDKFEGIVEEGGIIITDSSLVPRRPSKEGVDVYEIPATQMATDMGNHTYACIILLGKLVEKTGIISKENFEQALKKVLPQKKHYMIPEEMKAFEMGMKY
ncbi:2-oxoacid:ferredoxin oxidoreductase subunit gamma [Clostridium thermosuccinogenes]|jgi:2-oxoglutarate ferredoxin oxidoreductase subunit gamma|uniref:2-oxoacid:ferredoxin oxidoreductase subunit gamma n=1 Tax=Clostridium thermosuccinogenes TaxID=84032 RepID=A0A2K2FA07_9CLOT|nr:2-oxoacid:acceptor oxidoreductase family protein [Pseudoclostridium thermosuccinogenes]AUS96604.1 2-oxoacid:ferredoxin oxidoreductase subunit gamma [Pseudoclostridium thermosuccinogenes]PNT92735.1 2-oxoacid:ferredoxin oxidoreductase subunit gamma [Pseudoclostridium thermosuccinogenes]PNT94941.1 2-oxoacid:ferredoxin oxidoreductase subunit gamma [Pseudoclostridium thermosuccinogenes]PNT95587.1 2-oxoacid:ferredoxin oxidoreductase subunit gamma [Pseudoclostridium thermosuccinogenes]